MMLTIDKCGLSTGLQFSSHYMRAVCIMIHNTRLSMLKFTKEYFLEQKIQHIHEVKYINIWASNAFCMKIKLHGSSGRWCQMNDNVCIKIIVTSIDKHKLQDP